MKAGVAHYFGRGLGGGGGGGGATARFGGSATTAARLHGALSGLASGRASGGEVIVDPAAIKGRDAQVILRAIVEAVRPVDGTQDAEASREAIGEALAEVLKQNPDADLQDLTDDQRLLAVQEYLARDMFHRLVLDVGGAIKTHAASARVYLKRLDQIRAYLRQGIAAAFRRMVAAGEQATRSRIAEISRSAIADAIGVFEEYLK